MAALLRFLGPLACEAERGDSIYGELSWSLALPGPVCTYTEVLNGFDLEQGPSVWWSVAVAYLVLGRGSFTRPRRSPGRRTERDLVSAA